MTTRGAVLLSVLVLAVVAFVGALAVSHRGLTGSISHGFNTLTNTHAPVPAETPGRLTAIGSVRAVYWNEALKVFQAHPALGAGARSYGTASLRYRTEDLEANDAHGFVVQTLADLGLVGLAIVLALLLDLDGRRGARDASLQPALDELARAGTRRLAGHRLAPSRGSRRAGRTARLQPGADRDAEHALPRGRVRRPLHRRLDLVRARRRLRRAVCAGWLAGRGPLTGTLRSRSRDRGPRDGSTGRAGGSSFNEIGPLRLGIAAAVVIAALLAAWAQWQPQRSADASQEALALSATDPGAARTDAQNAVDYDPVSAEALFTLSTIQQHAGQSALARATLVRAVHLQPSNPQTWKALGEYDLQNGKPTAALNELRATVYLNPLAVAPLAEIQYDPELLAIQNAYIEALRESTAATTAARHVTVVRSPSAVKGIVRSPGGIKSVTVVRSPAAAAARRAALRRAARRRLESRSPRATR